MIKYLVPILLLLLFGACGRYHLVEDYNLPYRSVAVVFEENSTYQAQVKASLINHTRQSILRDGTTHLTSEENADAFLLLSVVQFDRQIISTEEGDTARAENYRVQLQVKADLLLKNGEVLFENRIFTASKPVRSATGEFGLVIDQDIPYLTQEVARNLTLAITGQW